MRECNKNHITLWGAYIKSPFYFPAPHSDLSTAADKKSLPNRQISPMVQKQFGARPGSSWVFQNSNDSAGNCANNCANNCGNNVDENSTFRAAVVAVPILDVKTKRDLSAATGKNLRLTGKLVPWFIKQWVVPLSGSWVFNNSNTSAGNCANNCANNCGNNVNNDSDFRAAVVAVPTLLNKVKRVLRNSGGLCKSNYINRSLYKEDRTMELSLPTTWAGKAGREFPRATVIAFAQ